MHLLGFGDAPQQPAPIELATCQCHLGEPSHGARGAPAILLGPRNRQRRASLKFPAVESPLEDREPAEVIALTGLPPAPPECSRGHGAPSREVDGFGGTPSLERQLGVYAQIHRLDEWKSPRRERLRLVDEPTCFVEVTALHGTQREAMEEQCRPTVVTELPKEAQALFPGRVRELLVDVERGIAHTSQCTRTQSGWQRLRPREKIAYPLLSSSA